MTDYEIWNLIIRSLTMIIVGAGLFYTGYQIKLSRLFHRDNHDWNRRIESQKALVHYNTTVMSTKLNEMFDFMNINKSIPLDKIMSEIEKSKETQNLIHRYLNIYEGYARGIIQGIYDEELIKNARRGVMVKTYLRFKEYIEFRKQQWGPTAWKELESMANKWNHESTNYKERDKTGG